MAHGKTLELREIRRPQPEFVVQHATKMVKVGNRGLVAVKDRTYVGGFAVSREGRWVPYTNPARDLKRNARLRHERFVELLQELHLAVQAQDGAA